MYILIIGNQRIKAGGDEEFCVTSSTKDRILNRMIVMRKYFLDIIWPPLKKGYLGIDFPCYTFQEYYKDPQNVTTINYLLRYAQ